MVLRVVAIFVLIALMMMPVAALGQDDGAEPDPAEEESAVEAVDRPPTEYFAYGAVGLLLLLLLGVGVGYVRTAMKTAEAE